VNVFAMELLEFGGDTARVRVHCSAGTYLRSIAHETGQKLGCGAFLDALRRTSSGDFTEDQARTLDQLTSLATAGAFDQAIVPASQLLPDFPNATVDAMTVSQIRQGKDFRLSPFVDRSGAKHVKAVSPEGDLIAIGEARLPHLYHPILVL
jgi:tRNA pseudouridine55 synthase